MIVHRLVLTEAKVMFRAKGAVLWFFAMPLMYAFFFGFALRGPQERAKIGLGVRDADGGWLAAKLVQELRAEGYDVRAVAAPELEKDGWKPRTLLVPRGFTAGALKGEAVALTLRCSPDADASAAVSAEANVRRAVIRVVAALCLSSSDQPGPAPPTEASFARSLGAPPLVSLEVVSAGKYRQPPSGYSQTIPGTVVHFVLMCLLLYGIHLFLDERASGLLRRAAVSPVRPWEVICGKVLSRAAVGVAQIALLFGVGRALFGVHLGASIPGLALLMVVYALCVAALSLLLAAFIRSAEQATGVSVLLSLVMAALGGCWWPLELVPSPMREVGLAFPTGWAMDGLHQLMAFGGGFSSVAAHVAVIAGMGLAFFLAAAWRLRGELSGRC